MPAQPLGITCGSRFNVEGLTTLPNVGYAMTGWFQKLSLAKVFNQTIDHETVETKQEFAAEGVVLPIPVNQLSLKPEGQRGWQWYALYCTDELPLKLGDTVVYQGVNYRVMGGNSYAPYGYMYYELVNSYGRAS